jgi:hypothetical protein
MSCTRKKKTEAIQPNRHIRERYPRAGPLANVLC